MHLKRRPPFGPVNISCSGEVPLDGLGKHVFDCAVFLRLSRGELLRTSSRLWLRRIDLLQGTLDLLILKSLGTGRNHGYGIAIRLHQLSDDVLKVEEGSLYPALDRWRSRG